MESLNESSYYILIFFTEVYFVFFYIASLTLPIWQVEEPLQWPGEAFHYNHGVRQISLPHSQGVIYHNYSWDKPYSQHAASIILPHTVNQYQNKISSCSHRQIRCLQGTCFCPIHHSSSSLWPSSIAPLKLLVSQTHGLITTVWWLPESMYIGLSS